ncbi:hypothetical protein GCM10025787_48310 [Saccharopolyspora rosea]
MPVPDAAGSTAGGGADGLGGDCGAEQAAAPAATTPAIDSSRRLPKAGPRIAPPQST